MSRWARRVCEVAKPFPYAALSRKRQAGVVPRHVSASRFGSALVLARRPLAQRRELQPGMESVMSWSPSVSLALGVEARQGRLSAICDLWAPERGWCG